LMIGGDGREPAQSYMELVHRAGHLSLIKTTVAPCAILIGSAVRPCFAAKASVRPFLGRLHVDRQRMHGISEFLGQSRINHAMALDPALPFESLRYNIHSKVRLATRPMPGVALMQM
jgi:hypothetical protein